MENTISKSEQFISSFSGINQTEGNEVMIQKRNEALQAIQGLEIPTTRDEYWKYTRLAKLTKDNFFNLEATVDLSTLDLPELNGYKVVFVNGFLNAELSDSSFEEGLSVASLIDAKEDYAEVFSNYYGTILDAESQLFSAINTAYLTDGLFVKVAKNKVVEKPIHIIHVVTGDAVVAQPRNLVITETSSQVKLVNTYVTLAKGRGFNNVSTEIFVGENANVEWNKLQIEEGEKFHIDTEEVLQKSNSVFTSNAITLSGEIIRNNTNVLVDGENVETHVNGVCLAKGKQVMDNHVFIDHSKPNCNSNQVFKYIMEDSSRGVFNGKVLVRKDAQKINAFQSNQNILLSDSAIIDTKPELEIYADDVKCSHGTTTGQLDEDAIFYLQARGVGKDEAKKLLVLAFAEEALEGVSIESLRLYVNKLLEQRFNINIFEEIDWEA